MTLLRGWLAIVFPQILPWLSPLRQSFDYPFAYCYRLIVTQHSGDGKANQYFLRGFNLDHGTDFATTRACCCLACRSAGMRGLRAW